MRRSVPAVLAVAGLLLLAGCSASSNPTSVAQSCAGLTNGSASDAVKVTGKVGAEPKVSVAKAVDDEKPQRTVLTEGSGTKATKSTTSITAFGIYNAKTGKSLATTGWTTGSAAQAVTPGSASVPQGILDTMLCLPDGSRAVTVSPVKTAFKGVSLTGSGLKQSDSVIIVADILDVITSTKADGKVQSAPAGFPPVTLAKSGKPTVSTSTDPAPMETEVADLKKGDGATVKSGDSVTVQYQGSIYGTGKVFDQSWGRGLASFPTTGVVTGFSKALVGQKVGSQVIALIPPADGYGASGNANAGISGTDTLVFVVDILGTTAAPKG